MKSIKANYQVKSLINQFGRIKLKSEKNLSEKKKNTNDAIITIHNNFVP